MVEGVDASFREVLMRPEVVPDLAKALENIDPDNVSPKVTDIFGFAKYCRVSDIRCVIIGQDPYPNPAHAHGICFSSLDKAVPDSLKKIYECLRAHGHMNDDTIVGKEEKTSVVGGHANAYGPSYLGLWASQGVLMLNMALTTKPSVAGAHLEHWEPYTRKLIAYFGALERPMIFMLWGNYAKKMRALIKNPSALILEETHPSPMAQARLEESKKFQHCTHFDEANAYMRSHTLRPFDWNPRTRHIVYTDGSSSGVGTSASAGYAAYFHRGPLKGTKLWGKLQPVLFDDTFIFPTNQRAEGKAILVALEKIIAQKARCDVEIITDSDFWRNMITKYIPGWVKEGRPFADQKNPDIVKAIWDAVNMVKQQGILTIRHVYSHGKGDGQDPRDTRLNQLCDDLAKVGRQSADFHESEGVHYDAE